MLAYINEEDARYFKITILIIKLAAVVLGLVILYFSQFAFVFYSVAMVPTVAIVCVDREEQKSATATICVFNLIGILPYLSQLWASPSMDGTAKVLSSDISTWIVIYGSALVGQIVYWALPAAIAKLYLLKSKVDIANLDSQREKLCVDWNIKTDSFEAKQKTQR